MDDNIERGGVHVDVDYEIPNGPLWWLDIMGRVTTRSRKCTIDFLLHRRDMKESRSSQMGNALKAKGETTELELRHLKLELKHCWLELIVIRVV